MLCRQLANLNSFSHWWHPSCGAAALDITKSATHLAFTCRRLGFVPGMINRLGFNERFDGHNVDGKRRVPT